MTGRERLINILNKEPIDRLCWTTLVDATTLLAMPPSMQSMCPLDFYRHIGCDILQFGNYGLPRTLRLASPYRLAQPSTVVETVTDNDGTLMRRTITPWGELTATFRNGHPSTYPVQTVEAVRILMRLWQDSRVDETPGMEDTWTRIKATIGEAGIYVPTVGPSPVQQLIELDMGLIAFYGILKDYPREMISLLDAMHACRRQEYGILARRTSAPAVIAVENTSSTLTSPDIYRRYSLPHLRDFVDIMHAHGIRAILHMCGHLKHLLTAIQETGLDGINGLTPPPTGDTNVEQALDFFGDDFVLPGAVFNGDVFQKAGVTRGEIRRELEETVTPRFRTAHVALWLPADGLPTPPERFYAVREWMAEHGANCG
jgi:hypothetical protein